MKTIELLFDCLFFTRDEFQLSQLIKYRKTLFLTLKMRDLFQQIQDMTDYNPRIINSARSVEKIGIVKFDENSQ